MIWQSGGLEVFSSAFYLAFHSLDPDALIAWGYEAEGGEG